MSSREKEQTSFCISPPLPPPLPVRKRKKCQQYIMSQAGVNFLDRGPAYIRARMMHRDSGLARQHRRSAVELLEESKSLYIKPDSVDSAGHRTVGTFIMQNNTARQRVGSGSVAQDSGRPSAGVTATPSTAVSDHLLFKQQVQDQSKPGGSPCIYSLQQQQQQQQQQAVFAWQGPPCNGMCDIDNQTRQQQQQQHQRQQQQKNNNNSIMCEEDVEGVQSDFSGLSLKRPKYNDEDMDCGKVCTATTTTTKPDTVEAKPAAGIPTISAEEWREGVTTDRTVSESTSCEMEHHTSAGSPVMAPVLDHNLVSVKRRHKKPLSRSRTDLTKRFSSSSDLSELSARLSRNSADLEKFFNEMGLEKGVLEPLVASALAQRPSCMSMLDNVSSIDSIDARSWGSDDSQKQDGPKSMEVTDKVPSSIGGTSVVERNARVIKWLCSVRKSSTPPDSEN